MRVERTGSVEPLTPRFTRYLNAALSGVSQDEIQGATERRIDYVCLRGLLGIEIKTLEEPPTDRLRNLVDERQGVGDWPPFLGSAPLDSFIKNTVDPDVTGRLVTERVGRAIANHLKKANRQFEAHKNKFHRQNFVSVVVLINEDHEIYTPESAGYAIKQFFLKRKTEGSHVFIDAVIYLTERHATVQDGMIAFPVVALEGSGVEAAPWKDQVLQLLMARWARWNGTHSFTGNFKFTDFEAIDAIPPQMTRSDFWCLQYRRNPYMAHLTDEQLRDRFEESTVKSMLFGVLGAPIKISLEDFISSMPEFSGIMIEMGRRAIPITRFPMDSSRLVLASQRLGYSRDVSEWIMDLYTKKGSTE